MALFKTITQGGQVHIHQLHMLKQVLVAGLIVASITGFSYFAWKTYQFPSYEWRVFSQTSWAQVMIATNPSQKHPDLYQDYVPLKGKPYRRSCLSIINDPLLKKITKQMENKIEQNARISLWVALAGFLGVMILWFFMGRFQRQTEHQRGTTLLPWRKLAKLIRKQKEDSDLAIIVNNGNQTKDVEKLPLLKNKETSHMLITGTTGSGKTNNFHLLLPQIRKRGDRAIILDVTGDYVSRYYDPTCDIILNPLDTRSVSWTPWADCHFDSHYDVLAESFVQTKEGKQDPFWDTASRGLLKTALRKYAYQKNENISELSTFLLSSPDKEFENFFRDTEAANYAKSTAEKTTQSIRSVLSTQIEGLRHLGVDQKPEDGSKQSSPQTTSQNLIVPRSSEAKNGDHPSSKEANSPKTESSFSIRKWVMDDQALLVKSSGKAKASRHSATRSNGWLFITARADQKQSLTPLISAWTDIAINALMVLPENYNRRLWFILDELAALQKLPSLQRGLAEGRKYGGCFLAGFQSKSQLEDIYGQRAAETMLDLFNTKIFFRCTEPSTQSWISKVLGDKEETEPQENISYGANSMRDGVSLSRQTRQKPLILPTELSQLKDREAYIKLPGDFPCTKLQMPCQKVLASNTPPFILKPEKQRAYPTHKQSKKEKVSQEEKEY